MLCGNDIGFYALFWRNSDVATHVPHDIERDLQTIVYHNGGRNRLRHRSSDFDVYPVPRADLISFHRKLSKNFLVGQPHRFVCVVVLLGALA